MATECRYEMTLERNDQSRYETTWVRIDFQKTFRIQLNLVRIEKSGYEMT